MDKYTLPTDDLDYVLDCVDWRSLRGNVFLTGGTGFIGIWLIETFLYAREKLGLTNTLSVLTRNIISANSRHPHLLKHSGFMWREGDITAPMPWYWDHSYTIHAACDSVGRDDATNPLHTWNTIVNGTSLLLRHTSQSRGQQRFMFVSSHGVCYADPENSDAVYANAKLAAESLCGIYHKQTGIRTAVVRPYAIVGPYLPLNAHYAIGNFIRDGLRGGPIRVNGDGTEVRTYVYSADLTAAMWTVLLGECSGTHEFQGPFPITIEQLACLVADQFSPRPDVYVAGKLSTCTVFLNDQAIVTAIRKTIDWNRNRKTAT